MATNSMWLAEVKGMQVMETNKEWPAEALCILCIVQHNYDLKNHCQKSLLLRKSVLSQSFIYNVGLLAILVTVSR